VNDDEKGLYKLYMDINAELNGLLKMNDYQSALMALAKFTKPIDDLFVKVMVMDKDERLKANRLALLKTIEREYLELADFSKIVM
jgi:glycyl-tRNA synthetase beta chain